MTNKEKQMSDTIRMRRLKQQIAEKVITDKKIIEELREKGIRQDNKDLKKMYESETVRIRQLKQKIEEAVRKVGKPYREQIEHDRISQWIYDHGEHPATWKQMGYKLPKDLDEQLFNLESSNYKTGIKGNYND